MTNTLTQPNKLKGYCRNKDGKLTCWEMVEEEALTVGSVKAFTEELTIAIKANEFYILPGLTLIQGGKA